VVTAGTIFLLALVGLGLGASTAHARIRHVIHVSVDGLRGDLLQQLLETQAGAYGTFARIRAEGAVTFNARCDYDASTTIPNHTSMITGLPLQAPASAPEWQQHGYITNYSVPGETLHAHGVPAGYKPSVFDRVHDRGGRTLLLASKEKFSLFDRSYDATNGAPDVEGADDGRDKIDFTLIQNGDSSILAAVLISRMGEDFPAYTFLHIFDPDYAGHLHGWGSLSWQLAVKHADSLLGLILSALQLRPALQETTALVITSDHGGGVPAWNHVDPAPWENYTIPVMIWGPGVPHGIDAYSLFADRGDPGASRPANDAASPPLRNGDTGNIALALLGLPPIPGSFYRPGWADGLQLDSFAHGEVVCSWPAYLTGWSLETTDRLESGSWAPVVSEPLEVNGRRIHVEPADARPQRFYRLRGPE